MLQMLCIILKIIVKTVQELSKWCFIAKHDFSIGVLIIKPTSLIMCMTVLLKHINLLSIIFWEIWILYSTKCWQGEIWHFWHFPVRPSKFNLSKLFKSSSYSITGVWWKTVTIRQIFEESVSVKIFPRQKFALYGIC